MRNFWCYFALLWPITVCSAQPTPVIPQSQNLVAVVYFAGGNQTGCGLRATGVVNGEVWLNVLINVSLPESGVIFGMLKVDAKRVNRKDGEILFKDDRVNYSSAGRIDNAWIRTDSGVQPVYYKGSESRHGDGYIIKMESGSTMDLLAEIAQASFKVGISNHTRKTEEIYQFDDRIEQSEVEELVTCMRNLRGEFVKYNSRNDF